MIALIIARYFDLTCVVMSSVLLLLFRIVSTVIAFILVDVVASKINWKDSRFVSFGISMSMIVYMFHNQIIFSITHWLYKDVSLYVLILCCFVGALGVTCLIGTLLKRSRVTRFLIGEKIK